MIELIDQSEPDKLKYRCTLCGRVFAQPSAARLDLHQPVLTADAVKAGIPVCVPLPPAAAPPTESPEPKARRAKKAVAL